MAFKALFLALVLSVHRRRCGRLSGVLLVLSTALVVSAAR
jgi:hypothetical protein